MKKNTVENISNNNFKEIISRIKNDVRKTQLKTMSQANSNLIMLYFRIGKILSENSKYGNSFIKNTSIELNMAFPNIKGFSERNLKRMKRFYNEYKSFEKMPQVVAQLPWGHNIMLFEKIKDMNTRMIYANATIENGWSRNVLAMQIESKYHERIGNSTTNFNMALTSIDSDLANNILKDPYVFDFIELTNNYKEKELENAMIEKIKQVLLELGKGFSFVGSEYKVSTPENDYYIDLLFYHLELRCYIVVELKATPFKPEYIGQLGFYVTAVNETLKKDIDNPTIGLLLCQEKDKISVEWSLKGTNLPIGVSSFKISEKEILSKLPTEEDINLHIDIDE